MKAKIYNITEKSQTPKITGNGQKGLIIIGSLTDLNLHKNTLEGIIKAIGYDIEADVSILYLDNQSIDLSTTFPMSSINQIIIFGVDPSSVGFNIHAFPNFWYNMEYFSILISESLEILNSQKDKKLALWGQLKKKFLPE